MKGTIPMKKIGCVTTAILTAGMIAGSGAIAQSAQPTTTTETNSTHTQSTTTGAQPNWTVDQLMTASVHDAWVMSGRNEQKFFEMATALAQISAQKRGLTLPNSAEAGKRFGELVKEGAKGDHDQLLYSVVDKAVQQVGTKS
jgi:hypothetical protein